VTASRKQKRLISISLFLLLLFFLLLLANTRPVPTPVSITLNGYTNTTTTRFALFAIHNQDSLTLRWRGYAVEVEGDPMQKAPLVNPNLPQLKSPTLKSGQSLIIAIGDPTEGEKWRLSLKFTRYTLKERLRDYAFKFRLPLPFKPPDIQTATSPWLTNEISAIISR
jgi:hypothetical protein